MGSHTSPILWTAKCHTITKPTRITHNTATLIDNIYISTNHKPDIHSALLTFDISDHLPVITCVGHDKYTTKRKPKIIKTRHINEDVKANISNTIKITNWQYLEQLNTNDAFIAFTNKLNDIINNEVQEKTVIVPASRIIRDPWITTGLITSSRKLNKLYKMQIGKDKNHPKSTKYSQYRNAYNSLKRKAKSTFYNELFIKYRHDIRKTWGVINSLIGKTNDKSSISETFKINNAPINDPELIANEFCKLFTNIGKKYANDIPTSQFSFDHYMGNKSILNMFLSPTDPYEVAKLIDSLKRKNSSGHDGLTSINQY